MIAKLTGVLDSAGEDRVVVDVAGVGYLVFCSGRTLARLPATGQTVAFAIETHVREDHIHLYGFAETAERDWFRLLTTVQGVGARVALAILTVLGPNELAQAIAAGDKAQLTRADGVGAKLAARVLNELREKVDAIALGPAAATAPDGPGMGDAVSALVNLGYSRSDAFGAVAHAVRRLGRDAEVEDLVRLGLRELAA